MGISEYQRAKLHHRDETRQVLDFSVWIASIEYTREIEEFCSLVNLGPESLLEGLFGRALDSCLFD